MPPWSTSTTPGSSASPASTVQNIKDLRHLSYSSLTRLDSCPLSFLGRYGLKVPERRSAPQYLGITVHHTLDALHTGQTTPERATDHFAQAWNNQSAWEPVPWGSIDWNRQDPAKKQEQAQQFFNHGLALVETYLPHAGKNIPGRLSDGSPTSEFQVSVSLDQYGGQHFTELIARIDLLTLDQRLLDIKTKMAWSEDKKLNQTDWDMTMQFELYAFCLAELGLITLPVETRFVQLLYGREYAHDDSVGGWLPAWRIDRFRQLTLPRLVRKAEYIAALIKTSPDPVKTIEPLARKSKEGCQYCSLKSRGCPLFNPP